MSKDERMKQLEDELRLLKAESDEKYRLVFENTKETFFVQDFEKNEYTFIGGATYELFGYTNDEMKQLLEQHGILDMLVPQYVEKANRLSLEHAKNYYETEQLPRYQYEAQMYRRDGSVFWVEVSMRLIADANGILTRALGVVSNIDERKKAESEIARYREKLELLVKERTDELAATNEELHATSEELTATNEELAATNEEMTATNELLTVANEELNRYRTHLEEIVNQRTLKVIKDKNIIETLINSVDNASLIRLQLDPAEVAPGKLSSDEIWGKYLRLVYAKTNWNIPGVFEMNGMKTMQDVLRIFYYYRPEDIARFRTLMHEALRSLSSFNMETCLILPGNDTQWHHLAVRPFIDDELIVFDLFFFDITKHKKIEIALAASERKQRFVFDNTKEVFWIADLETTLLTYVGGNCLETFGNVSDAYVGMSFYECFLPEVRGKIETLFNNQVEEYYKTGVQHFQVIEQHYDKNGVLIWMESTFQLVPDENGKITQIVGVEKDIDARIQLEVELANYREKLEHLVKERTDELIATNEELSATNEELASINDELYNKNNQLADEVIIRMEMMKRLEDNERKLRNFIEQSHAGILILDNDGHITEWNRELARLTGIPREEALGEYCWIIFRDIMPEEAVGKIQHMIQSYSEGEALSEENMEILIRHGKFEYQVILTSFIIEQEGKFNIGMICRDVSEQKLADIELEKYRTQLEFMVEQKTKELVDAKEKAEESDRLKSAFLANMSHEIRTPLNGIVGFLQFIDDNNLPPIRRKEYIKVIHNNSRQLAKLIDDIIDVSKIEARQMTIFPVSVHLNELMNEFRIFFETNLQTIGKEHIKLVLDNSGFIDNCVINVDSLRLRQVFNNLIGNAAKFTQKGYIRFGYRQSAPDRLEFVVEDTGIGLAPDQQEIIFERFRQADISTGLQYGGTGLGLTISRSLVQMMGGEMWVESTEGDGATFYFTIPYMPVAPEDAQISSSFFQNEQNM